MKEDGRRRFRPGQEDVRQFGRSMQIARKTANKQQKDLAEALGYSQTSVAGWEVGTNVPDTPKVVFEIEKLLGCAPGTLSWHLGYVPRSDADRTPSTVDRTAISDALFEKRAAVVRADESRKVAAKEQDQMIVYAYRTGVFPQSEIAHITGMTKQRVSQIIKESGEEGTPRRP